MPSKEEQLLFSSIISHVSNPETKKTPEDNKVLMEIRQQALSSILSGGAIGSLSMFFIGMKTLSPNHRPFGVIAGTLLGLTVGSAMIPLDKGIGKILQLQSPIGDYARQSAVEILPQSHPLRDFNKYSVNNSSTGMEMPEEIENHYRENEMLKESQYDSYSYNNNQNRASYNTNNNNNKAYEINNNYNNNNNYTKEPEYQYQKSRYSLENERYNNNINNNNHRNIPQQSHNNRSNYNDNTSSNYSDNISSNDGSMITDDKLALAEINRRKRLQKQHAKRPLYNEEQTIDMTRDTYENMG